MNENKMNKKIKQEKHMYEVGRQIFILLLIYGFGLKGCEIESVLHSNNLNHLISEYE